MKLFAASACVVSLLVVACSSPRTDAGTSDQEPQVSKSEAVRWTGKVSEEEFKAMHVLRQGAAPKTFGTMIEIAGSRAYLSLPPNAKAPLPGIVVIHEWWGLNEHIMHWADRLAADGYASVAVDLYGGVVAKNADDALKAMKAVDQKRANEILLAAHKFLAADPRIQAKKRGSIGWCFGGHQSLRLALAAPDLDAVVMYYGFPITDPAALEPLQADLLGIFGTRDTSIPPPAVAEFDAALTKAGKRHRFHSFDAEHAFANPSNAIYDEKAAAEAWKTTSEFLARHLKSAR